MLSRRQVKSGAKLIAISLFIKKTHKLESYHFNALFIFSFLFLVVERVGGR